MDGWIDKWMDGWMDGWMDEWMDGWMDGCMDEYTGTNRPRAGLVGQWLVKHQKCVLGLVGGSEIKDKAKNLIKYNAIQCNKMQYNA